MLTFSFCHTLPLFTQSFAHTSHEPLTLLVTVFLHQFYSPLFTQGGRWCIIIMDYVVVFSVIELLYVDNDDISHSLALLLSLKGIY